MDNMVVILMFVGLFIGATLMLISESYGKSLVYVGLAVSLLSMFGGVIALTGNLSQTRTHIETKITDIKQKQAVNQAQINDLLAQMKGLDKNADSYRVLQTKYYQKTQTQKQLTDQLNTQRVKLSRTELHGIY